MFWNTEAFLFVEESLCTPQDFSMHSSFETETF